MNKQTIIQKLNTFVCLVNDELLRVSQFASFPFRRIYILSPKTTKPPCNTKLTPSPTTGQSGAIIQIAPDEGARNF